MTESQSVTFHTLKKCYKIGEDVVPSFTVTGFTPSKRDWIGIFPVEAENNDKPCTYQWIPSSSITNEDTVTTLSVSLKTDFTLNDDVTNYEIRYIDADQEIKGKTKPFEIAVLAQQESIITFKEGTSSDDSIILIEKTNLAENEKNTEEISKNLKTAQEDLQLLREELDSNVADKELSNDLLEAEKGRRVIAESAVEDLSRTLREQMRFINEQGKEVIELRNTCERNEHVKESFMVEYETMQENAELYATELEDTRDIAINYKTECAKLQKKIGKDEELLDLLKLQLLEDRDQHEENIQKMKESESAKLKQMQNSINLLEEALEKEREKMKSLEQINEKNEVVLKKKSEQIINDLAKIESLNSELENERENHKKLTQENEMTICELESRVVNESSNASRLENELATAENRYKDSTEDIKFFRQKFIDTEQKLTKSQQLLSQTMIELNNLKNLVHHKRIETNNTGTATISPTTESTGTEVKCESATKETATPEISVDDKSTNCDASLSATTCTSAETMTSVDRRRAPGDVTDDESWCGESMKSQSFESVISRASERSKPPAGLIHLTPFKRQQEAEEEITARSTTLIREPQNNTTREQLQQIPVINDNNRLTPKKGRRRYSKPIDELSPSPSFIQERREANQQQSFLKDIADLDRESLEKQYVAIRQHRNSLMRESSFLKDKIQRLKTDLVFMNKSIENIVLEAEHKIGMMQFAMYSNNQPYPPMPPLPTQTANYNQMLTPPPPPPPATTPTTTRQNREEPKYLSPYAAEYTPLQPPSQEEFFQYIAQQAEQGNFFPIPQNLPPPPPLQQFNQMAEDGFDVRQQLASIGVPVSSL